ncbi:acyl-CoA dehydrogenase family protein [Xanthobacter autotrophicus]|uniref:acyl-CoA dehydrogenase family protein n=1 Tax=Xanthobacter autotrophicus TaxID=280 RepID=UPI003729DAED
MNILVRATDAPRAVSTAEDRAALVDAVRRLLADRSDKAAVRRTLTTEAGYDAGLWRDLAALGVAGLIIDEVDGGTGLGAVELELVAEEIGAALVCGPFLSSSVLAAALLQALGRREHLPAIAAGTLIVTVAVAGQKGGWTRDDVGVIANGGELSGVAGFVLDAQNADLLLVVARGLDGIGIFEVPTNSPGLKIESLPTFDRSRRLAHVHFSGVKGRPIGVGWAAVEKALDVARIALAGEQAGGAREMLARTAEYAKQRFQFGRAIGSFQAIKHMAADLLLESESSISAARNAAELFDAGAEGADLAIALASFACADAFVRVCADAIQMHGGIGFTWEHPAHLYLRRARSGAQLFGSSAFYRERFVQVLAGPSPEVEHADQ